MALPSQLAERANPWTRPAAGQGSLYDLVEVARLAGRAEAMIESVEQAVDGRSKRHAPRPLVSNEPPSVRSEEARLLPGPAVPGGRGSLWPLRHCNANRGPPPKVSVPILAQAVYAVGKGLSNPKGSCRQVQSGVQPPHSDRLTHHTGASRLRNGPASRGAWAKDTLAGVAMSHMTCGSLSECGRLRPLCLPRGLGARSISPPTGILAPGWAVVNGQASVAVIPQSGT